MDIKCLFMDVDGTLTDGKLYIGNEGEVMKAFSVKDGHGIKTLRDEFKVIPVILTGRNSKIVRKRCEELKIDNIRQNVKDKVAEIKKYEKEYPKGQFAFIGDDDNDLGAIEHVQALGGITACPADASNAVKKSVDYICRCAGGQGAVREFIDYMIDNKIITHR